MYNYNEIFSHVALILFRLKLMNYACSASSAGNYPRKSLWARGRQRRVSVTNQTRKNHLNIDGSFAQDNRSSTERETKPVACLYNNYSMSPRWIWSYKITNERVARVGYNHFKSNKGEWNNCFSKFSNRVLPPIFISTILQSENV